MSHPKITSVVCRLLRAKCNISFRLKRNFCISLWLPGRIRIRGLVHNRLSETTSFDLSIRQGKLLFTKCLFLSPCKEALKPPRCVTSSLAQCVLHTSILLSISEPIMHVGSLTLSYLRSSHTYICFKFGYFLWLICLMSIWLVEQPEEPWG